MYQTVQTRPSTISEPAGQSKIDVLLQYGNSPVAVILAIAFLIKVLLPVMLRK